jgi:hypothetical protein
MALSPVKVLRGTVTFDIETGLLLFFLSFLFISRLPSRDMGNHQ